ncbi:MAG TPA: hypothetical protein VKD04_14100 [Burkholderiales bacterium]|nr:hypothetical protein [Burkholderiales bacterium]
MKTLPDPRRYPLFSSNLLVKLAQQALGQGSALQHEKPAGNLRDAFEQALRSGDDALIRQALAESTSHAVFRMLAAALDSALKAPGDAALHLRMFAIPILIVTGGRGPLIVSGVVTDVGELTKLFELHGTLGPMRNFALGSTLVSATGLGALKPSAVFQRSRETSQENFAPLDLPPDDIRVAGPEEEVHLRFLTGVAVTSADAPGFTETAGNIGAWGMPFTRALAAQLGQPGLSLLPIPRPPMGYLQALESGQFALSELGFQLFLTTALRKFRSRVGEAEAAVAACADGSVRVRLSSPFDASLSQQYFWQLPPGDDMAAVGSSIFSLLEECRVTNVQVAETVQPVSASH